MRFILILIFIFLLLVSNISIPKKATNIILFFVALFLIVFTTFREGSINRDYDTYVKEFYSDDATIEISYQFISLSIRTFLKSPLFLFFIYALLGVGLKFLAINRLTTLTLLSVTIYYTNFFLFHEMTQIRAGVAAAFFLLSLPPLFSGDKKSFFLLILGGTLFHYSGILYGCVYFLKRDSLNKYLWAFFIPFAYLLYFINFDILGLLSYVQLEHIKYKYEVYLALTEGEERTRNVFNIIQILRILIAALLIVKSDYLIEKNYASYLLIKIYIIGIISLPLFIKIPDIAIRLSELFLIVEIILIPFLYYLFKQKYIGRWAICFIGVVFIFVNLYYAPIFKF